ncbi:glyoxalase [Nocardia farcinica]|uniref:glyoxalase n=1 Tax=Nocardia farcinica TaxID=37329 RepID=UPI0018933D53|nr:glyoxalase [Nocardia farcinica]MBF6260436.1 glyoxalase [Nocardia farcinica]MBF6279894.1 glyoxalase [Nocardia farcinica]MBF6303446.1 glyoxalase [Nocardia farcinica]MBF6388488.1 glyoxalase [Nocardia farcinica]MBF6491786.1 glyoxalase [Nocardia farcinica]
MADSPVPVLWTSTPSVTLDFYRALGYTVLDAQTKPYVYLALEYEGCPVHFAPPPPGVPVPLENVGCLVMVDDVAARHAAFTAAMRAAYGKVLAKGCPRITRFRPGQSRFSLIDPDGNTLLFIQRDEAPEVDYGGASELTGLAKVIDNARILRDFKVDDTAAARMLEVGLRRYRVLAPAVEQAKALAMLAELAVAAGDTARAERFRADVAGLTLTDDERAAVAAEVRAGTELQRWLSDSR